jgi:hypothetical protein
VVALLLYFGWASLAIDLEIDCFSPQEQAAAPPYY